MPRASHDLPAGHPIPRPDHHRRQEGVRRLQPAVVDGHRPVANDGAGEADHAAVCGEHRGFLEDEKVNTPMTRISADRRETLIDRSREWRCQTNAAGVKQDGDGENDGQGNPFLPAAAAPPYRQPGAVGRGSMELADGGHFGANHGEDGGSQIRCRIGLRQHFGTA